MDDDYMLMDPGGRLPYLPTSGLDDFLHEGGADGLAVAAAEATFNQEPIIKCFHC